MEDKQISTTSMGNKTTKTKRTPQAQYPETKHAFDWSIQQMIPVVNFHLSWDCSSEREANVAAQPFGKLLQHAMKTTLLHRLVIQTESWIFTHIMGMTCMLIHPERAQPHYSHGISVYLLSKDLQCRTTLLLVTISWRGQRYAQRLWETLAYSVAHCVVRTHSNTLVSPMNTVFIQRENEGVTWQPSIARLI
jgi:hypothetical protein